MEIGSVATFTFSLAGSYLLGKPGHDSSGKFTTRLHDCIQHADTEMAKGIDGMETSMNSIFTKFQEERLMKSCAKSDK